MRLHKKLMVLGASVAACAGQICTIFLMDMRLSEISISTAPTCAGGHGGPPLRGDFGIRLSNQRVSRSNVATRSAVECGARGPGAESDSFIISGASAYRRLRHEREASTAQAISITAAPTCVSGHSGPPLRRELVSKSSYESMQNQRIERSAVSIRGRNPPTPRNHILL